MPETPMRTSTSGKDSADRPLRGYIRKRIAGRPLTADESLLFPATHLSLWMFLRPRMVGLH